MGSTLVFTWMFVGYSPLPGMLNYMLEKPETVTFLDLGCKHGGAIGLFEKLFPGEKGMGVDIQRKNIEEARNAGYHAVEADVTDLALEDDQFSFVVMCHFLEHLPSYDHSSKVVNTAIKASRDFVYIRQPNFDNDAYLMDLGLKFNFSDWRGHPNRMSCLELFNILSEAKGKRLINDFVIAYKKRVQDSSQKNIHCLTSPRNSQAFDPSIHPPKPEIAFGDIEVFLEIVAVAAISASTSIDHVLEKTGVDKIKFDSRKSQKSNLAADILPSPMPASSYCNK